MPNMNKLQHGSSEMPNSPMSYSSLAQSIAHHDAAIEGLGQRMGGVEGGLRTLQGEVHHGFADVTRNVSNQIGAIASKIDRLDAAPKFDLHKIVGTVVSLAVLFGMVCAGIIYITQSQTSAAVAEQKVFNQITAKTLERHDGQISEINGWRSTVLITSSKGAHK